MSEKKIIRVSELIDWNRSRELFNYEHNFIRYQIKNSIQFTIF